MFFVVVVTKTTKARSVFHLFNIKSKDVQMLYFSLSPILIPQAKFCLLNSFFIQKQVERQLGMLSCQESQKVSALSLITSLRSLCFMLKTA